jgi:hypothetical protein
MQIETYTSSQEMPIKYIKRTISKNNPVLCVTVTVGKIQILSYIHNKKTGQVRGTLLFESLDHYLDCGEIEITHANESGEKSIILIENVELLETAKIDKKLSNTPLAYFGYIKE